MEIIFTGKVVRVILAREVEFMEIDKGNIVIDINKPYALSRFSSEFTDILRVMYTKEYRQLVILCIGSDRSTGDCLGPLVGHKLRLIKYRNVSVYGTLEDPVHAKNLEEMINQIHKNYERPFIIAIDASLGRSSSIGCISIGNGPILPGAGVYKDLPAVGDMHITGTVNMGGFMEFLVLQNTRLSLVMKMSEVISNGIHYGLWKVLLDSKMDGI